MLSLVEAEMLRAQQSKKGWLASLCRLPYAYLACTVQHCAGQVSTDMMRVTQMLCTDLDSQVSNGAQQYPFTSCVQCAVKHCKEVAAHALQHSSIILSQEDLQAENASLSRPGRPSICSSDPSERLHHILLQNRRSIFMKLYHKTGRCSLL